MPTIVQETHLLPIRSALTCCAKKHYKRDSSPCYRLLLRLRLRCVELPPLLRPRCSSRSAAHLSLCLPLSYQCPFIADRKPLYSAFYSRQPYMHSHQTQPGGHRFESQCMRIFLPVIQDYSCP